MSPEAHYSSQEFKSEKPKESGSHLGVSMKSVPSIVNTEPIPSSKTSFVPEIPVQAQVNSALNEMPSEEDKYKEKGKGKTVEGEAKLGPSSEVEEPTERFDVCDLIRIPGSSRKLRRLSCTPRFHSHNGRPDHSNGDNPCKLGEAHRSTDSDAEQKERKENRTIHATLAHRMRDCYYPMGSGFVEIYDDWGIMNFLIVMYHGLTGSQELTSKCGLLHKDITPREVKFYYLPDKRIVGVLNHLDMYRRTGFEREKEVEAHKKWKMSYRSVARLQNLIFRDDTMISAYPG